MVTVRYWAAARAAAGCRQESVAAETVGELVALLQQRPELARVLRTSSLLIDGVAATVAESDRSLAGADEVHVLPPFAGG